ncbi:MAG TPA: TIGR03364 family FAD-dependent oxidoreductase [Steroidobacteraceae bacterium]|nr:TIGR03364 family FAD-dependent oxidoreductase [Steroidobacteraceae bacterium]HXA92546.1 TIGR03364 family FAD-dependent oxidoreductase [Steroidobacteraceae bacterium]
MTSARASREYDLAIVGAGIVGLSCALAAARRRLKVVVIERDARACGASVRNFGLITITGQDREGVWPRARRSRAVWQEVAAQAGVRIVNQGLWVAARRAESAAVLEAFLRSDMAEGCRLLTPSEAQQRCPNLQTSDLHAVLFSPHELRVESRDAIPALARWLAREHGVTFCWETAVHAADPPTLETSRGPVSAAAAVVCPGDDLATLFPERLAAAGVGRCTLQMLRLESPGFALPGTVMSDLSLVRYGGFASLPEAVALRRRLETEQGEHLAHGIHLIIAQGSDGSLVVGDSHHHDAGPFADERIYGFLLDEYRTVIGSPPPPVRERWMGTYAVAKDRVVLIDAPSPRVRLVLVTSGIGASTGFAIGEEVIGDLFG